MEPEQIMLVQESWEEVVPIADKAAELFYGKLFEINAEEQGRKLMSTLNLVVRGLNKPEALVPVLKELGRRHLNYCVQNEHYDTVGGALLWTLEQGLGDASQGR